MQAKVKLIADLIWSKLSGVFTKEVLHAQHVSCFCRILQGHNAKGKRQLDCAGVVTTVLAALQQISNLEGHEDLKSCCLQARLSQGHHRLLICCQISTMVHLV